MSAKQKNRLSKRKQADAARKSKPARRSATPRSDRRLDFIDAAARVLDLAIEPAWKPAIAANLEATLRLAASFMEFPLPDDAEPAPIFVA
jgi:1-carboxybiuret hydrolase subunit AtzG-like protein